MDLFEELGEEEEARFVVAREEVKESEEEEKERKEETVLRGGDDRVERKRRRALFVAKAVVLKRRFSQRMTGRQELANAVTQLGPSLYFAWAAERRQWRASVAVWFMMASVWVHLPFSVCYHIRCCLRSKDENFEPLSDGLRRLDHTFIHVSAACVAFGTSNSWKYFLICGLFNALGAGLHWTKEVRVARNQFFAAVAIFLYVAPLIYYSISDADLADDFINAFTTAFIAGLIFRTYVFGGYSHAIFHVVMTLFSHFILDSAFAVASKQKAHNLHITDLLALFHELTREALIAIIRSKRFLFKSKLRIHHDDADPIGAENIAKGSSSGTLSSLTTNTSFVLPLFLGAANHAAKLALGNLVLGNRFLPFIFRSDKNSILVAADPLAQHTHTTHDRGGSCDDTTTTTTNEKQTSLFTQPTRPQQQQQP